MPRCAHLLLSSVPIWLLVGWGGFPPGLAASSEGGAGATNFAVWDQSVNVRAGAGYKDNVLFGASNPEGSGFETVGLDVMLLRLSTSGTSFNCFLSGDDTRYFQARDVDKEQSFITQAELKTDFGVDWKGAFAVQYFYQNQVLDASVTDTNRSTVKARGHNLSAHPSLRRQLAANYWLALELAVQRQWFAAPLENYWQGGPKLTLGRDLARQSSLALSYSLNRRAYDDFEEVALDRTPIPGTSVAFWVHEAELAWHQHWDEQRHWRSSTRLIYGRNEDNGAGFFNYQNYRLVQQLRYQCKPWQLEGRVAISRYNFDRQTVSDADLSKRRKTGVTFSVRGERQILKSVKVFADYEYERSLSNLGFDNYQVNQVTAGVDWEF